MGGNNLADYRRKKNLSLAEAAKQRVSSLPTWLVLESVYYAIQFTLSGLAIAFIYSD